MRGKWTRRELAAAVAASATLLGQTPAEPPRLSADEELKAAREEIRQNGEQLARFPLPMATEPAAHFKA